eukprot:TRINITY_DN2877_c0_g1_i3.p1 TRINITY_DN2877_c0_g1~~TRINITY_DN2877_c0_g1_i3.p1  ORF type:complete len:1247 (-),score=236.72 TRINITY_DN2877_c0_g1_i3:302-3943(-)
MRLEVCRRRICLSGGFSKFRFTRVFGRCMLRRNRTRLVVQAKRKKKVKVREVGPDEGFDMDMVEYLKFGQLVGDTPKEVILNLKEKGVETKLDDTAKQFYQEWDEAERADYQYHKRLAEYEDRPSYPQGPAFLNSPSKDKKLQSAQNFAQQDDDEFSDYHQQEFAIRQQRLQQRTQALQRLKELGNRNEFMGKWSPVTGTSKGWEDVIPDSIDVNKPVGRDLYEISQKAGELSTIVSVGVEDKVTEPNYDDLFDDEDDAEMSYEEFEALLAQEEKDGNDTFSSSSSLFASSKAPKKVSVRMPELVRPGLQPGMPTKVVQTSQVVQMPLKKPIPQIVKPKLAARPSRVGQNEDQESEEERSQLSDFEIARIQQAELDAEMEQDAKVTLTSTDVKNLLSRVPSSTKTRSPQKQKGSLLKLERPTMKVSPAKETEGDEDDELVQEFTLEEDDYLDVGQATQNISKQIQRERTRKQAVKGSSKLSLSSKPIRQIQEDEKVGDKDGAQEEEIQPEEQVQQDTLSDEDYLDIGEATATISKQLQNQRQSKQKGKANGSMPSLTSKPARQKQEVEGEQLRLRGLSSDQQLSAQDGETLEVEKLTKIEQKEVTQDSEKEELQKSKSRKFKDSQDSKDIQSKTEMKKPGDVLQQQTREKRPQTKKQDLPQKLVRPSQRAEKDLDAKLAVDQGQSKDVSEEQSKKQKSIEQQGDQESDLNETQEEIVIQENEEQLVNGQEIVEDAKIPKIVVKHQISEAVSSQHQNGPRSELSQKKEVQLQTVGSTGRSLSSGNGDFGGKSGGIGGDGDTSQSLSQRPTRPSSNVFSLKSRITLSSKGNSSDDGREDGEDIDDEEEDIVTGEKGRERDAEQASKTEKVRRPDTRGRHDHNSDKPKQDMEAIVKLGNQFQKDQTVFDVKVVATAATGFICDTDHPGLPSMFMNLKQMDNSRITNIMYMWALYGQKDLGNKKKAMGCYLGTTLKACVTHVLDNGRIYISEKLAHSRLRNWEQADLELLEKNEGLVVDAVVVGILGFGLLVRFKVEIEGKTVEGIGGIHQFEIAWNRDQASTSNYQIDQVVQAKICGVDIEKKQVQLSIRQLKSNPILKSLEEDVKKVLGQTDDREDLGDAEQEDMPEVEQLKLLLQKQPGIVNVQSKLRVKGRASAQELQVFMSKDVEEVSEDIHAFSLLVRLGLDVQEIVVTTSINRSDFKNLLALVVEDIKGQ